ncbi:uncharacterized protein L203_105796 [Cryptococcus depauperatus CBS 7841]|uniref:Uncharacterized protein n=1 Tax=Cryptococcus depauperatus CBS 7841 TaxID=1295531 RepID=A0A1E3IBM8_9TREE|nr:hypothetical protein L203_04934 [Cryptococcus depauperatus CBS 7841]
MSLNTIQLGSNGIPSLLPNEELLTQGNSAQITLSIPPSLQGPKRTVDAKGNIWVTDQRVVFITDSLKAAGPTDVGSSTDGPPGYDAQHSLNSVEIGYSVLRSCTYNLPTFSANHILLTFIPSPYSSSLPQISSSQHIELKAVIGEGAGHGVWKRIEGERGRAEERVNAARDELPAYEGAPPAFDEPPKY